MRRIMIGAALALLISALAASQAAASHTSVGVGIYMGFNEETLHEGTAACSGAGAATPCTVTVDLGGRDYGRFVRACGKHLTEYGPAIVIVGQNASTNNFCNGNRGFQVRWFAVTNSVVDHELGVWVYLVVTR
jgi:hypothetical protein